MEETEGKGWRSEGHEWNPRGGRDEGGEEDKKEKEGEEKEILGDNEGWQYNMVP